MSELIGRTNQFYGGLRPYVYRVFLTHGEMDPRRHLGPQTDLNPDAPVVVMSRKTNKLNSQETQIIFPSQLSSIVWP